MAASCSRAITARATTRTPAGSIRPCSKACSSERLRSNVLGKTPVELRPAIAEEAECGAVLLGLCQVERRHQHARLLGAKLGKDVAPLVADEAVAVEALAVLGADAVGRDDRHDIRHCMSDHRAAP